MQQTNFLLASSAVIPLLALALLLEIRAFEIPPPPPGIGASVFRGDMFAALAFFVYFAGLSSYGEWVCLRSLELDRSIGGGTLVVWIAVGSLAGLVVIQLGIRVALAGWRPFE